MTSKRLTVLPIQAPIQQDRFDLHATLIQAIEDSGEALQQGDVVVVSSKYAAISEGRVVALDDVVVSAKAASLAERYHMNPAVAQLVLQEADHIFGGIELGFLLTANNAVISPNAGLDRSNIPSGFAVLLPEYPYATAERIRLALRAYWSVDVGVILADSWLVPGRLGTTGVALGSAGFQPVEDERGKADLFGNPMSVT